MVLLTGNSLSKRQQELNNKVNEAVAGNVDFNEIKAETDTTDVDILYKIDLAAKCKNVDYIVETLKSGDSLYISRVLKKALWLYDDEYSNIINADYLHHNIFPLMSIKMKKKLMKSIALQLRNEDRAIDFYNFCIKGEMTDIAPKFLNNTSESFKLKFMRENSATLHKLDEDGLKNIFKNSFDLLEAYLAQSTWNHNGVLKKCSYLYAINNIKYLELFEKYATIDKYTQTTFGLRISKDIVTKHKDRILSNPSLYVSMLNVSILLRHSNLSDVKLYAVSLLPKKAIEFWDRGIYRKYKRIIDAIPERERYEFVKKMFTDSYPNQEFEMTKEFYNQEYYVLMTPEEKEHWALRHIESNKEILGSGRDYLWYQYVSFDKAFVEIKKFINTATDYSKRSELLKILALSAKTNRELEKLFKYYYDRHVNEKKNITEYFLRQVIASHNVLMFDPDCWEAFNKIFCCLDVYVPNSRSNPDFKIISILYHIVNGKEMPEILINHMEHEVSVYSTKHYLLLLDDEKRQLVYEYIINFYLERIKKFEPGTKNGKCIAHIHFTLEYMAIFKKTKKDIPDAIMEFVNSDVESFRNQQILEEKKISKDLTGDDLLRYLKKDSKLVIDKIPELKERLLNYSIYDRLILNRFLNKVKIYFTGDDLSVRCIQLFKDLINQDHDAYSNFVLSGVTTAVFGFFRISDEKSKVELLNKFVPAEPKVDYSSDNRYLLHARESICRFACYSRPPVPLSNILMYLKGDYVKFCLPMFQMYCANLPQPLCLKFVESLLDSPVSIQKHGLRLAFKCFSTDSLSRLVQNAWKATKNVSLRCIIYKAVYEKTVEKQNKDLYETLKHITLDLHSDDDDSIFTLISMKELGLSGYEGDFIEAVWATVEKFKDNKLNVNRKTEVIKLMDKILYVMKKENVIKIVSDHIDTLFNEQEDKVIDAAHELATLHLAKWALTAHYIVYFATTEEDQSESSAMALRIIGKYLKDWNRVSWGFYLNRRLFAEFVNDLKKIRFVPHPTRTGLLPEARSHENSANILQMILNELQASLPLSDIYLHVWDIKISIAIRRVIKESRVKFEKGNRVEAIEKTSMEFGNRVGDLVKEFVEKEIYFSYFTKDVVALIKSCAFDIQYYIGLDGCDDLNIDHILVGMARGLLDTESVQAGLLALQILPLDPKCNILYFKQVHTILKEHPNVEIKSCFNKIFTGDFMSRPF